MQSLNISDKIRNMDVTDAWNTVKKEVLSVVEVCVPNVKIGVARSRPQWMNNDVTTKIQKKKLV